METDEKNPYTPLEVKSNIENELNDLVQQKKVKVMVVPDIESVNYGRGVGYNIEQLELSKELQQVSATKIRAGEIGQDGKPLGKRPE